MEPVNDDHLAQMNASDVQRHLNIWQPCLTSLCVNILTDGAVLCSGTCSAERETGLSLGGIGDNVFWMGALGGGCGCDWHGAGVTGVVSGDSVSGMLCKMIPETDETVRERRWQILMSAFWFSVLFFTLWTDWPCLECGWGTKHPGLSSETPNLVSSGRRTRRPPLPGRECYETHQPMTVHGKMHT